MTLQMSVELPVSAYHLKRWRRTLLADNGKRSGARWPDAVATFLTSAQFSKSYNTFIVVLFIYHLCWFVRAFEINSHLRSDKHYITPTRTHQRPQTSATFYHELHALYHEATINVHVPIDSKKKTITTCTTTCTKTGLFTKVHRCWGHMWHATALAPPSSHA